MEQKISSLYIGGLIAQAESVSFSTAKKTEFGASSSFPEKSAGAMMTSDYVALDRKTTAAQAMAQIRREAEKKENIHHCYVVDEFRRLVGVVSLRDLLVAPPECVLEKCMHKKALFTHVEANQEEAVRMVREHRLTTLPVLNRNGVLAGILTHDAAMDAYERENEDRQENARSRHAAGSYFRTSTWAHFTNRAYWIVGLAALELISGFIIHSFETTLTHMLLLALYMPMVTDTGGNTGGQSSTLMVRALAVGEIQPKDVWKILFKELKISLLVALTLALLSFGKILFLSSGADLPAGLSLNAVAATIALALSLQVVTSTLIGAVLPLGVTKLGWDPAVIASPALTTIVDITGLLIYFETARIVLGV